MELRRVLTPIYRGPEILATLGGDADMNFVLGGIKQDKPVIQVV